MSWFQLALAAIAVTALLFIPGALATWGAGLKGLWRWALMAPAGAAIVALASILSGLAGTSWSVLWVAITAVLVTVVLRLLRRFFWPQPEAAPLRQGSRRTLIVATSAAGIVLAVQLILVIGNPENISQTFDNIFHLNAIRYALDTGNASPLWLGTMTSAASGGVPFYPSLWHAIGSLTVQLTGASIPVASNAVMIVFAAVVWPLSIMLLVRTLLGSNRSVLITAALLLSSIPAFPLKLVDYGVLFPYMAGLAMVPAALAALVMAANPAVSTPARVSFGVIVIGVIPGIAVAHPGAFVALIAMGSLVLAISLVRALRIAGSARSRVLLVIAAGVYGVIALGAWYVLRPVAEARTWGPIETVGQAFGEVATVSVNGASVNIVVALLVIIGIVGAVRRRGRGDIIAFSLFALLALLYVAVAGLQYWTLRDILVGAWYNNVPRLAAILPIAWVIIGARGGQILWEWLSTVLARRHITSRGIAVFGVVATAVGFVVPQVMNVRPAVQWTAGMFAYSDNSPLVTTDELALLSRLPEHTTPDDVVAGSSWNGAGMAYALEHRRVLMPHTLMDMTDDIVLINGELDDATPGSAVCAAVEREGVTFVLDFGDQQINGENHPMPGFDSLATSHAVELVDEEGDVALYRVVGCTD